jgi:hypothetical protein
VPQPTVLLHARRLNVYITLELQYFLKV